MSVLYEQYDIDTVNEFFAFVSTVRDSLHGIPLPNDFAIVVSITKSLASEIADELNSKEGTNYKDLGSIDCAGLMVYFLFRPEQKDD